MVEKVTWSRRVFLILTYIGLGLLCFSCLYPFWRAICMSFSTKLAALSGVVNFFPVGFNLESYQRLLRQPNFLRALSVTLQRLGLGLPINFLAIVLTAYPLSRESNRLRFRTAYTWFFVFTMLFSSGIIPWYMNIRNLGLLDTIWALVLPGALPVYSVMLVMNYFRGLPKEIEEASLVDGAGHFRILFQIFIPISKPVLATVMLFAFIGHWNSWFDGIILMNKTYNYPLQSFMQQFVIRSDRQIFNVKDLITLKNASEATVKSALIVLGALPVLLIFPFLQRFLHKGIVLGSVKG